MKNLLGSFLVLLLLPATAGAAGPELRLDLQSVVATEVTPGGAAVFFSVSREPLAWMEQVVCRAAFLTDEDGDGTVAFLLEGELAWKSIWAVVDFQTGELALATPEGYPLEEMDHAVVKGLFGGPSERIRSGPNQPESLNVLIVKPKVGAWSQVLEGGRLVAQRDLLDGSPAETTGRPAEAISDHHPKPPRPDEVFVAIDPHTMATFALGPAKQASREGGRR